jgi:hypothetical protein
MDEIQTFFNSLTDQQLIDSYNKLLVTLKERQIIRTNNLVGDLGEFIAINYYNNKQDLPNLVLADTNETAFDAYQQENQNVKFTIKSTSRNMTGIFWGLEHKYSEIVDAQIFDYVIIVKFGANYQLEHIYQIDWQTFLDVKTWHSTTKAWTIKLTRNLINRATTIL